MKYTKFFFLSLIAASLMAMPLIASSVDEEMTQAPIEEIGIPADEIPETDEPRNSKENDGLMENGVGQWTSHKGSNHIYMGATLFGDQVVIEDGSYWETNPADREKLQKWRAGHNIIIMQNTAWFGAPEYGYKLYNQDKSLTDYASRTIDVDLRTTVPESFYSHHIMEIYKPASGDGWLKLNDGSKWILYSKYSEAWKLWEVRDTVIIGTYNAFIPFFTPDILINATCSVQYIPSKCVY